MADPIMPFGFAEISDGEGNWHEDHNDNFQKVNDKLTPLVDLITAIADLDVLLYDTVTERMEKYQFGDIFSINVSSRRIDIKADFGNFSTDDIMYWGGSQIKGLGLNTDFFEILATTLEPKFPAGTTLDRPGSPKLHQDYFDTDLGHPIWWDGSNWVDAQGNTV